MVPGVDNHGHVYHLNFFDAFYFVSYMATTIGFGETPYTFTYAQRLWVSVAIYLSVVGWFYAIGAIISLIQDEALQKAIKINRFRKQVKNLKEDFYIILEYTKVTKNIIEEANGYSRFVVIDENPLHIEELNLEDFYPYVPSIVGNPTSENILTLAGIDLPNCKGIISLFDKDAKNMQAITVARLLNHDIDIIVKATSKNHINYYNSIGIEHILNPFTIVASQIYNNIVTPYVYILERWVYGQSLFFDDHDFLPKGKYLICGHGRMGSAIADALAKANIEYEIYNIDPKDYLEEKGSMVFGDEEDQKILQQFQLETFEAIIAATSDDMLNLTLLNKAKEINPNIYAIARENSLDDAAIFEAAHMDRIYILEKVLSDYTINIISRPVVNDFLNTVKDRRNDHLGQVIVAKLLTIIGDNPLYYETTIDKNHAYALHRRLQSGESITLGELKRSRANRKDTLKIVYLLLERDRNKVLIPSNDTEIQIGDRLLIAANTEEIEDFEYILNNIYELEYVLDRPEITSLPKPQPA